MKTDLLLNQTTNAYQWTNKLLESLPADCWPTLPPVIETNALWQTGHLLVSIYFNTMVVIKGHQPGIFQSMPLKLYSQLFTQATPASAMNQVEPQQLFEHLKTMQNHSSEIIKSLTEHDLNALLMPGEIVHPVAKTKFEAINWNVNHTFWHCGQIAMIKRVVHKRYRFNLVVT